MDDRFREELTAFLGSHDGPPSCRRCGGREVAISVVPVDPSLGMSMLPVTHCRACDAGDPEVAEIFAFIDDTMRRHDEN